MTDETSPLIKPDPLGPTGALVKKEESVQDTSPLIGITARSLVQQMKSKRTKTPQELLPKWLSIIRRKLRALVKAGEVVNELYLLGSSFNEEGRVFSKGDAIFLARKINENRAVEGFLARQVGCTSIEITWSMQQ